MAIRDCYCAQKLSRFGRSNCEGLFLKAKIDANFVLTIGVIYRPSNASHANTALLDDIVKDQLYSSGDLSVRSTVTCLLDQQ